MDSIGYVDVRTLPMLRLICLEFLCSQELMERSGFRLIEVEEDDIKRKRWTLPLEDSSAVRTANRAWAELGMRLAGIDNRTSGIFASYSPIYRRLIINFSSRTASRQESLAGTLATESLSGAIQTGLSSAANAQPSTDSPGDRRKTFDTREFRSCVDGSRLRA